MDAVKRAMVAYEKENKMLIYGYANSGKTYKKSVRKYGRPKGCIAWNKGLKGGKNG